MASNGTYRWPPQNNSGKPVEWKKLLKFSAIALVAIFVLVGVLTCFYTVDDKQQAVVTTFGKVTDITREFTLENFITVKADGVIDDLAALENVCMYVDNDGEQNGVYQIKSAKAHSSGEILIDIGDVTLIRRYCDKYAPEKGFVYNIEAGQSFRIPLTHTFNK